MVQWPNTSFALNDLRIVFSRVRSLLEELRNFSVLLNSCRAQEESNGERHQKNRHACVTAMQPQRTPLADSKPKNQKASYD